MCLLLNLIQLCYITTIINFTYGYVLVAANLDDFRNIAKKLVPGKLADQLTKMASQSNIKYRQELINHGHYSSDADDSSESSNDTNDVSDKKEEETKKRYVISKGTIQPAAEKPNIDIDAIVEKVKERLESEYSKAKQYNAKSNTQVNTDREDTSTYTKLRIYNNTKQDKNINKEPNLNEKRAKKKQKVYTNTVNRKVEATKKDADSKIDYADALGETKELVTNSEIEYEISDSTRKPTHKKRKKSFYDNEEEKEVAYDLKTTPENQFFKGYDLAKNRDSYDDYVTPKKDDIFASDGPRERPKKRKENSSKEKMFNRVKKNPKTIAQAAFSSRSSERDSKKEDLDYTDNKEEEIKARTESLWFDDSIVNATEGAVRKVKSGTMIPTKRYYTMSSPNYYAKLPVVAQKYNFDEPLPQKDREPEESKPILDPSANINGKVRLY